MNIDKVNKTTYMYYHNWWFHHNFMMNSLMHSQMQNRLPRFGPNLQMINYYFKDKKKSE